MNLMNGKPVIGAPRVRHGMKVRYAVESESVEKAEDQLPLDYAEIRTLVTRARRRGLMWEEAEKPKEKTAKPSKVAPKVQIPKTYGKGTCINCQKSFEKLSLRSFFCDPCKWDPRPCKVCGTDFTPNSGPKRGIVIQSCGKQCALELMRRQRIGKPPANKGQRK